MKKLCNCEAKGKKSCHCNKYILGLVAILIILSIWFGFNKQSKDKDIVAIENNTTKLLVTGSGNEPGWNVKVYGVDLKQTIFKTDFILDYGDSIYSGILAQTDGGNIDTNFQFRGDVNLIIDGNISTTTENVILYFEKVACIDDSGATRNYKVELNLNSEKEYKGCANLVTEVK